MPATAAARVQASKVKVLANRLRLFIIVPTEKSDLAWGGSQWVQITEEGLAAGDAKPLTFLTVEGATCYGRNQGFQVEPN
jgi:hypothetical protein